MKTVYKNFNSWLEALKDCHFKDNKKKIVAQFQGNIIGEFNKTTLNGWVL